MNKAKLALSAVAMFAVIGGALAFKASRLQPNVYTRTTTQQGGPLTCVTLPFVTTVPGAGAAAIVYTAPNCPVTVLTRITEDNIE